MYLLPTILIALGFLFAGIAWIFFARSQAGRKQATLLGWLALPMFANAMTYIYFTVVNVDISVRAAYARYGFMAITISQGIILMVVSFLNWGKYGKQR